MAADSPAFAPFDPHVDAAPRRALRALTELQRELPRLEAALVDQARSMGIPWRCIAGDLGLSTTATYRRHVAHDRYAAWRREERRARSEFGWPL